VLRQGSLPAHLDAGDEAYTLGLDLRDSLVDQGLVELEVGDAVAQETARLVGALVDGDRVTCARELLCAGETRRSRANHAHGATAERSGANRRQARMVGDLLFDLLDRNGLRSRSRHAEHARALARRRAHAPGDLGEVVRA